MGHFNIFNMQPIIELEKVSKYFGGITALNKASLKVNKGEVVGLIGDNGAGKSTLIKTLVGVHSPDNGNIKIRGDVVNNWNALKAREAGIETVFQDRALCPQQSIVWNIFMGKELKYPFGFIREKEQINEANRLIREIGLTSKLINAQSPVGNLSGGERQGVAIARAIYNNAELIILDEPTNNLSLNETQKVFDFVINVKKSNRSVLFIGHNIYHVYDISDRFVILDRGEVVHHLNKEDVQSPEELMKIMRDTIQGH
jgi:simple sugar transport system ATP-binding protein